MRFIAFQNVRSSESTPGRAGDAAANSTARRRRTTFSSTSSSGRRQGGTGAEKATGGGSAIIRRTTVATRAEDVHLREVVVVQILPEDGVEALAVVRVVRLWKNNTIDRDFNAVKSEYRREKKKKKNDEKENQKLQELHK